MRGKCWDGVQREVVSTTLVCEHHGYIGCELFTSASVSYVLEITHNELSLRTSSARRKITFYPDAY